MNRLVKECSPLIKKGTARYSTYKNTCYKILTRTANVEGKPKRDDDFPLREQKIVVNNTTLA